MAGQITGLPCSSHFVLRQSCPRLHTHVASSAKRRSTPLCRGYKVELDVQGQVHTIEVEEGDTILQAALDSGIELSHDCKMGVCMTCPAKLVFGRVDQSAGMLDDDAKEKGYTLLCVSEPQEDCKIATIEEDEILEQVLCSSG